ncbi:EipA family protein [Thermodesulfobacteriota bacterium]
MKSGKRKWVWLSLVLVAVMICAPTVLASSHEPSATVSIESTSVAIGIGVQWGDGVLTFKGKEYKFKIDGLSVIDLGVSKISASGDVYHLKDVADFAGTYTAAEAGIALGGGVGAQTMKNQKGVVMNLKSTKSGIKLKLAPEGITIKMK